MVGLSPSKQVLREYLVGGGVYTKKLLLIAEGLTTYAAFFEAIPDAKRWRFISIKRALQSDVVVSNRWLWGLETVALAERTSSLRCAVVHYIMVDRVEVASVLGLLGTVHRRSH